MKFKQGDIVNNHHTEYNHSSYKILESINDKYIIRFLGHGALKYNASVSKLNIDIVESRALDAYYQLYDFGFSKDLEEVLKD